MSLIPIPSWAFLRKYSINKPLTEFVNKYEEVRDQLDEISNELERHSSKIDKRYSLSLDKLYEANLDLF